MTPEDISYAYNSVPKIIDALTAGNRDAWFKKVDSLHKPGEWITSQTGELMQTFPERDLHIAAREIEAMTEAPPGCFTDRTERISDLCVAMTSPPTHCGRSVHSRGISPEYHTNCGPRSRYAPGYYRICRGIEQCHRP